MASNPEFEAKIRRKPNGEFDNKDNTKPTPIIADRRQQIMSFTYQDWLSVNGLTDEEAAQLNIANFAKLRQNANGCGYCGGKSKDAVLTNLMGEDCDVCESCYETLTRPSLRPGFSSYPDSDFSFYRGEFDMDEPTALPQDEAPTRSGTTTPDTGQSRQRDFSSELTTAADPHLDRMQQDRLMEEYSGQDSESFQIRKALSGNPNLSPDLARRLLKHPGRVSPNSIREQLASNPASPQDVLDNIASGSYGTEASARVAGNPSSSDEIVARAVSCRKSEQIKQAAMQRTPDTTGDYPGPETLRAVYETTTDPYLRAKVLGGPSSRNLTSDVIDDAIDADPKTRGIYTVRDNHRALANHELTEEQTDRLLDASIRHGSIDAIRNLAKPGHSGRMFPKIEARLYGIHDPEVQSNLASK